MITQAHAQPIADTEPAGRITGPAALSAGRLETLAGDSADHYLFSLIIAHAATDGRPLTEALGLDREALGELVARHCPAAGPAVADLPDDLDTGKDALEEEDLRALLLEHRAGRDEREEWLAAIVARRSLASNHLWQDMGFTHRRELNLMFRRHFPSLAALNAGDMKWKKFFYRQLCEREGLTLCKSPNCEVCDDFTECFEAEDGDPLSRLARLARD